jgi:hypothetical protein
MIEAYMQVDLYNPLAVAYMLHSLKSFDRVSDIFHINVIQCITPDTLLDINFSPIKTRSPQEKASLCSQYRIAQRMANGEKIWMMEHDAYLIPEREEIFRIIMSKYERMPVCNIGIAMECYAVQPKPAKHFCDLIENDSKTNLKGPMSVLHFAVDHYSKITRNNKNNVYWAKHGKENLTGISYDVSSAYKNPRVTIPSPVTQLIDSKRGTTVIDRVQAQGDRLFYKKETHPNFHFISVDKTL